MRGTWNHGGTRKVRLDVRSKAMRLRKVRFRAAMEVLKKKRPPVDAERAARIARLRAAGVKVLPW